jgi:(1->4)-alpha-D-glucan 1-alpha-D-glucosylmutase
MTDTPVRRATYRVQLTAEFGFDQAAAIVPYLARLGISHLYPSPVLQAAPGSTHGYDVIDHGRVSEALGGAAGFARLVAALRAAGLGLVLDVVPNHMSIRSRDNRWWWDVLEHGPSSPYASYFDVDWYPPEARLRNVVLLPVLTDHYGRVLEAGAIRLHRDGATFTVRYDDHVFPASPRSLAPLLRDAAAAAPEGRLGFLADVLEGLPAAATYDSAAAERLDRGWAGARDVLAALLADDAAAAQAVDGAVAGVNADYDKLDRLLDAQHYRLAFWQAAGRDLGYRRFFDVNSLIGLCVENERTFRDSHRLVFGWLRAGDVDGLRIDHPDGLRDPEQYLRRIHGAFPDAYVVVEKILAEGESLPATWPVAGTTGYTFLNQTTGLFVDPAAERPLTELYIAFTGERREAETADFAVVAREKKLLALRETLGSDVNRLAELLLQVCERHRRHRDYTRHQLTDAVRELAAAFPVYRSYVRPAAHEAGDADRRVIGAAVARAKAARPDLDAALFDFLESLLTLQVGGDLEADFVIRFQQLTGPAAAKGVEDTAHYCYNRFVALNEVGGDPGRFGLAPAAFHAAQADAARRAPAGMLTTATHDTKRGEDVRARLAALSLIPDEWAAAVHAWAERNARYRAGDQPSRNDEYLYYQTLVGTWPITTERAQAYMEKAAREAKQHTTWTAPSAPYEAALRAFVAATLADAEFTTALDRFVTPLVQAGRLVSLAQVLLKLTAPGVPDFYQGTELWSHTLVDPDNRRPVDYKLRRGLLDELCTMAVDDVMRRADEGLPKLWLIWKTLLLRAERLADFAAGAGYEPLAARGALADHVVAFSRNGAVVTVVPRLMRRLTEWEDTSLPLPGSGDWRNVLTGDAAPNPLPLSEAFTRFPVALLVR